MRKKVYRASEQDAWALFRREPYLDVAGVSADGEPILRTFNAVVQEGALLFHCGTVGEKMQLFGRRVVAQARRPLTVIPSYFVDPVMACPATTYFMSAQARGVLEAVKEPAEKARCLTAFMGRHQPEGGHAPIDTANPDYARALEGVTVGRLRPEQVVAKHKLGQNRSARVMNGVLEGLWKRGGPGDLETFHLIHELHPQSPCPDRFRPASDIRLCVNPDAADARKLAPLLLAEYWWDADAPGATEHVVAAHLGSTAWVVARHETECVIGTARAVGDGVRRAVVMDMVVDPRFRGRGLGRSLLRTLLDHPRVRGAETVELRTRDAQGFYAPEGFVTAESPFTSMVLRRMRERAG